MFHSVMGRVVYALALVGMVKLAFTPPEVGGTAALFGLVLVLAALLVGAAMWDGVE